MSDAEQDRFKELTRALQDNPVGQANLLEVRARRLRDLDDLTARMQAALSDTALQAFEVRITAADGAEQAAKAASQAFAANSARNGIGSEAWKQLWESARRYSQLLADSGETFPFTREGALVSSASSRLTEPPRNVSLNLRNSCRTMFSNVRIRSGQTCGRTRLSLNH